MVHKVVLVEHAELGHIFPVGAEGGGIAVAVVNGGQTQGRLRFQGRIVGFARLRGKHGCDLIVIVADLDRGAGAVHDLVNSDFAKA